MNQIVSALVEHSTLPTRNDLVAKLPAQIEGMEKEALVEALSQIYRKAVESRGIEFQDIAGKEVGIKIRKVAEWMMGSPSAPAYSSREPSVPGRLLSCTRYTGSISSSSRP